MLGAIRSLINRLGLKPSGGSSTNLSATTLDPDWPTEREIIREGVIASGFSQCREADFAFYEEAHRSDRLRFDSVRKIGEPLSNDEKRSAGIAFRGIIGRDFFETLNDAGRADPLEAAQQLTFPIQNRLRSVEALKSYRVMGWQVIFMASEMAAGPCGHASKLHEQTLDPTPDLIVPFPDCPHPNQCGCMFRGSFDIDAMIEAELARDD
jgi:hypothetical protein